MGWKIISVQNPVRGRYGPIEAFGIIADGGSL
jgi:hypothetical protein